MDGVVLGRASLADPEYLDKVISGHPEKIRPCLGCNLGCINRLLKDGKPTCCAVNPTAMRELEYGIQPASEKKKVLVIGGVAGMEAARTSAVRGHQVTLVEKSDRLGGHLLSAGAHSFKKEIAELNAWYQRELKDLGIEVQMGKAVSAEELKDTDADVVILATGSVPVMPSVQGLDRPFVKNSLEAIAAPEAIGERVVIVGGGLVGCEIALDHAMHGKKVTVVEALDHILFSGVPAPTPNRQMIGDLFEKYHVNVLTSHLLKEVNESGVVLDHNGTRVEEAADSVIIAVGFKPAGSLAGAVDREKKEVYEIGDAKQAKTIMNAVWEGYEVVRSI